VINICRGPDPLEISPINPLDFRMENGVQIYEPGWWKQISAEHKKHKEQGQSQRGRSKGSAKHKRRK